MENIINFEKERLFIEKRFELEECLNEDGNLGNFSDGYHTFNELYQHRAVLFAVICNTSPDIAWKSLKHGDDTMYDGMFIVGIDTPFGQITYHYDIDPYWELFKVKELPNAPTWDGHTPNDVVHRLICLSQNVNK